MFELRPDQTALIEETARFIAAHPAAAPSAEGRAAASLKLYHSYCEGGYQALLVPSSAGGRGLDYTTAGLIYEELGYGCISVMPPLLTTAHCTEFIKIADSEKQKKRIFDMVTKDRSPLGFGLTEEQAGSDIAAIQCRADRRDGGYLINGKKTVVLNNLTAGAYVVIASTSPGSGRAGLNAFIVDAGAPGITKGGPYSGCAFQHTVTGWVEFNDVFVPADALLANEGSGYFLLMETFDKCRPFVAACCVGAARKVFDTIVEYAKSREQLGKPLFSFQGISFRLADFAARIRASRLLYLEALSHIDRDIEFTMEASIAKLYASEALRDVAQFGIETLGYRGIFEENPIQEIFQDAQLLISIDGSSNIQRMIIASQL